MVNDYVIDTITSVHIRETVKIGGKMIRIYEGVIYRENFKMLHFRKDIEILYASR